MLWSDFCLPTAWSKIIQNEMWLWEPMGVPTTRVNEFLNTHFRKCKRRITNRVLCYFKLTLYYSWNILLSFYFQNLSTSRVYIDRSCKIRLRSRFTHFYFLLYSCWNIFFPIFSFPFLHPSIPKTFVTEQTEMERATRWLWFVSSSVSPFWFLSLPQSSIPMVGKRETKHSNNDHNFSEVDLRTGFRLDFR